MLGRTVVRSPHSWRITADRPTIGYLTPLNFQWASPLSFPFLLTISTIPQSINDIQRKASLGTLELKSLSPLTTSQGPSSASMNNSSGGENNNIGAYVNEGSRNHQWIDKVQSTRSPNGKFMVSLVSHLNQLYTY